ncbi:cell adhesion molecule 1-like [Ceratina calcarata]|uniref:Cell adhesion molecule 1-like n=1 Tax=Ceratina calcarata TaxID=156304 RepID=A0AAJ7S9Y1_9HYME|nr:cell adhesion molecule 1-like [Ceratina calcarata]
MNKEIPNGVTGLKNLTIYVPAMVRSGDTVTLSCHYDLEGLSLYTIQWFLEATEFYRYLPEREPPYSTFNVDGIHVNVSKSNAFDVTLVNVSRKLTGMYKCEVSAGSPTYHTLIERSSMEVVDAPKTGPMIEIAKEWISVGELLRVNCTTGNSKPASVITWKLNGHLVSRILCSMFPYL